MPDSPDDICAAQVPFEFGVLGPLSVVVGVRRVAIGAQKLRTLLAILLLRANQVIPPSLLVDELWPEEPPATAANLVQQYVSRLRRLLHPEQAEQNGAYMLQTTAGGYVLRLDRCELDANRFEDLVEQARPATAANDPERAAQRLREALRLWRGPALVDASDAPSTAAEAVRLEERRRVALEERIEAELALGCHAELIGELRALVAGQPLQERLRGQLMVALYRAGRRVEALEAYRQGRQLLVEEQGIEPGTELQRLEHAMLTGDPSLAPGPAWNRRPAPVSTPCQLPAATADFTGRAKELARVRALLDRPDQPDTAAGVAVTVVALTGPAGVGKTTLGVQVAHLARDLFPDGQLFVDLRGSRSDPLDPAQALGRFLRLMTSGDDAVPAGLDERGELYRALLADRRVLIVLDDATSERQVRPLLPGVASCVVVVTSRTRLAGLEGAHLVELGPLLAGQAVELLGHIVGHERVRREAAEAAQIVQFCHRLPRYLRIVSARLVAQPSWTLAEFAERLAADHRHLDEVFIGELRLRAAIALSTMALEVEQRERGDRLLVPDHDHRTTWATRSLVERELDRTAKALERLAQTERLDGDIDQPRLRLVDADPDGDLPAEAVGGPAQ